MNVKPNHPLAEILASKLFAIETVPKEEQTKMVRRAIQAAVEFYDKQFPPTVIEEQKEPLFFGNYFRCSKCHNFVNNDDRDTHVCPQLEACELPPPKGGDFSPEAFKKVKI